jgi:hypothetical protein
MAGWTVASRAAPKAVQTVVLLADNLVVRSVECSVEMMAVQWVAYWDVHWVVMTVALWDVQTAGWMECLMVDSKVAELALTKVVLKVVQRVALMAELKVAKKDVSKAVPREPLTAASKAVHLVDWKAAKRAAHSDQH